MSYNDEPHDVGSNSVGTRLNSAAPGVWTSLPRISTVSKGPLDMLAFAKANVYLHEYALGSSS